MDISIRTGSVDNLVKKKLFFDKIIDSASQGAIKLLLNLFVKWRNSKHLKFMLQYKYKAKSNAKGGKENIQVFFYKLHKNNSTKRQS